MAPEIYREQLALSARGSGLTCFMLRFVAAAVVLISAAAPLSALNAPKAQDAPKALSAQKPQGPQTAQPTPNVPPAQDVQMVQANVIVSVREQKLMLLADGNKVATYPVSTSKFGLGDNWNSMATPTGTLQVAQKIGDHAPIGAVFRNRRFTGEILQPNAPGRDPVITRIIWLRGLEAENARAFARCIYIHGTPEEKTIGRPASYGCIRMKSSDVTALYAQLPIGAIVQITPDVLPKVKLAPKERVVSSQSIASVVPKQAEKTAPNLVVQRTRM